MNNHQYISVVWIYFLDDQIILIHWQLLRRYSTAKIQKPLAMTLLFGK